MKTKTKTIAQVKAMQEKKKQERFAKMYSQGLSNPDKMRPLSLKMSH